MRQNARLYEVGADSGKYGAHPHQVDSEKYSFLVVQLSLGNFFVLCVQQSWTTLAQSKVYGIEYAVNISTASFLTAASGGFVYSLVVFDLLRRISGN